jgi:peptide deformylase
MERIESNIRIFGDEVLRKRTKPVAKVTDEHRRILSAMARSMHDARGIGLAAPQIGISEAMIVVDIGSGLYKLINPKITKREGVQALEEGCLSFPGTYVKVKRSLRIMVEGLDDDGKPQKIEADELLACVFQHEIDHLHGKLIYDYASLFRKAQIKRKFRVLFGKITSGKGSFEAR